MGMMGTPLPPPPSMASPTALGQAVPPAQPQPNQISPAPPTAPFGPAMQAGKSVSVILDELKTIGTLFPTTRDTIAEVNNLIQEMQQKILQALPPSEPAAPPF